MFPVFLKIKMHMTLQGTGQVRTQDIAGRSRPGTAVQKKQRLMQNTANGLDGAWKRTDEYRRQEEDWHGNMPIAN